jgi:hypothetical protein
MFFNEGWELALAAKKSGHWVTNRKLRRKSKPSAIKVTTKEPKKIMLACCDVGFLGKPR